MDTIRTQLKTLNRQQGLYTKTKTMMKNNRIALLEQTYPGINARFGSPVREDGSQKWCVRNMSLAAFTERYHKWCKRNGYNFNQSRAAEIHTAAQDLIAMLPKDALTKTLVRQADDALNAVSKPLERQDRNASLGLSTSRISGRHGYARREGFPPAPNSWRKLGM